MTGPLLWTEKQIRAAAKISKEQKVVIKLGADGSLCVLPGLFDDVEFKWNIDRDKGRGYL